MEQENEGEEPGALGVDRVRNKSGYEWEAEFGAEQRDISQMKVFCTDLDVHDVTSRRSLMRSSSRGTQIGDELGDRPRRECIVLGSGVG